MTDALKQAQIASYGYPDTSPGDYEEDHVVALELGGAPASPINLFPEPHSASTPDDVLENALHAQVCKNKITLANAQAQILAAKVSHGYDRARSDTPTATTAAPTTVAPPPPRTAALAPPATPEPTAPPPTAAASPPPTQSCPNGTYINSSGNEVCSPYASPSGPPPPGATARCKDGTYSMSQHRQGTCSGHGGVAQFL